MSISLNCAPSNFFLLIYLAVIHILILSSCVVSVYVCRTVSRSEGEGLAARLDCAYFETSAAEDLSSVTTAFGRVLSDVIRLRDRQTLQVRYGIFTAQVGF